MSTIKPLDEDILGRAAVETGAIVTAEEHNVGMGMGTAISMVIAERKHVPMKRVGIPDVFGESGSSDELMEKYGLTVKNIVNAAHDVLKRKDKLSRLQKLSKKLSKSERKKGTKKDKSEKSGRKKAGKKARTSRGKSSRKKR